MMEPALQLALHGTAYRTGAVTSARRVLMSYELDGCAGDWQGPPWPAKGRQTGPFAADRAALGLDRFVSLPPSKTGLNPGSLPQLEKLCRNPINVVFHSQTTKLPTGVGTNLLLGSLTIPKGRLAAP